MSETGLVTFDRASTNGGEVTIAAVRGAVDISNATELQRAVVRLAEDGAHRMILDLSEVSFMSSVGIGSCVAILRAVKDRDGRLVLVGMRPRIHEVFELLGFTEFFEIAETRSAAFELLGAVPEHPALPRIDRCPVCGRRIRLSRPGRFRCGRCSSVIRVTPLGELRLS